jgi:hypothetical protein
MRLFSNTSVCLFFSSLVIDSIFTGRLLGATPGNYFTLYHQLLLQVSLFSVLSFENQP